MNLETHLKEGEQALARIWKVTALRGAVAIAFALVSGLATIAGAFSLPIRGGRRAWLVFEGLLGIAVGVVVELDRRVRPHATTKPVTHG